MEFLSIRICGERYCLVGNGELPSGREGEMSIVIAATDKGDLAVHFTPDASEYIPDLKLAMAVYLGRIKGYPVGEYELMAGDRRITLPTGERVGEGANFSGLRALSKTRLPIGEYYTVTSGVGVACLFACDRTEDFRAEDAAAVACREPMGGSIPEAVGAFARKGGGVELKVLYRGRGFGLMTRLFAQTALCALAEGVCHGEEVTVSSTLGTCRCRICGGGSVFLYPSDFRAARIIK